MKEIWKEIPQSIYWLGFKPMYEASNLGRIRNKKTQMEIIIGLRYNLKEHIVIAVFHFLFPMLYIQHLLEIATESVLSSKMETLRISM